MKRFIFDRLFNANREQPWDAPSYWTANDRRPMSSRQLREHQHRENQRWLRKAGLL